MEEVIAKNNMRIYHNIIGLEKFEVICVYEGTQNDNNNFTQDCVEQFINRMKKEKGETNEK